RIAAHYMASGRTAPMNVLTAAKNPTGTPFCLPCAVKALAGIFGLPVNAESGNFFHTFTDVSIAGRSYPLAVVRTYNSRNASTNGPFGYGWSYNYGTSLSCSGTTATITQENGGTVTFTTSGSCSSGTWTPSDPYTIATLSYSGGTWTFKRHNQDTYTFNS